jgi:hypothetical protein
MKLEKYKQNLRIDGNRVISYVTHVATIDGDKLIKEEWNVGGRSSSPTTTRHINYVARELNLELIK